MFGVKMSGGDIRKVILYLLQGDACGDLLLPLRHRVLQLLLLLLLLLLPLLLLLQAGLKVQQQRGIA